MPGAPSEWCPDWFPYFEAAEELRVIPWELAGFRYEPGAIPVCWLHWALEIRSVRAELASRPRK